MVLAVDIGNSRIKLAVFEHNSMLEQFVVTENEWLKKIEDLLLNFSIDEIITSSVGKNVQQQLENFNHRSKVTSISHENSFPFFNNYATPNTLGIDRMVLAAGSALTFPNVPRLIIDAGTCITYDFVDENDVYHGGAISPGIFTRYQSLHNFTARLPLLTREMPVAMTGDSTNQSIHSGVVNGILFEIDGFIDSYKAKHSNIIIILTGGDSDFLAKRLKNTIFANSNFLLESLNQLSQYKAQND